MGQIDEGILWVLCNTKWGRARGVFLEHSFLELTTNEPYLLYQLLLLQEVLMKSETETADGT